MAYVAAAASGGGGGTRKYIFNDEFVNNYSAAQIVARGGTYYDTVYWGMDGRYDGKGTDKWAYKTVPYFDNIQNKYLKIHVARCYARCGQVRIGVFDSNGNALYNTMILNKTSSGTDSGGFENTWITIDMSAFSYQTGALYFAFTGYCGYDSGQYWQLWMDKIYLTNEED